MARSRAYASVRKCHARHNESAPSLGGGAAESSQSLGHSHYAERGALCAGKGSTRAPLQHEGAVSHTFFPSPPGRPGGAAGGRGTEAGTVKARKAPCGILLIESILASCNNRPGASPECMRVVPGSTRAYGHHTGDIRAPHGRHMGAIRTADEHHTVGIKVS